jgi:hypothetical protein
MNPLIDEIYKTRNVKDSQGREVDPFPTSIGYDLGMVLYNIVANTNARKTLEVGMAYGLSTLFICQAHKDKVQGQHTTIDPLEETRFRSIGLLNIRRAGLEKHLRFYGAGSESVLPELLSHGEHFDFIFVDGIHLFDYTLVEFFFSDRLLDNGGHIVFHDLWMPSIRSVVNFVLKNRNYELAPQVAWKKYSSPNRVLNFLKDVKQVPFNLYLLGFSLKRLTTGMPNYCVLRKLSDDHRDWRHHKAF